MSALRHALVLTGVFVVILVCFALVTQYVLRNYVEKAINQDLIDQSTLLSIELTNASPSSLTAIALATDRFSGLITDYQTHDGQQLIGEFNASVFDNLGMQDIEESKLFNETYSSYYDPDILPNELSERDLSILIENIDEGIDDAYTAEQLSAHEAVPEFDDYPDMPSLEAHDALGYYPNDEFSHEAPLLWRVHVTTVNNGRLAVATPLYEIGIIDTNLPLSLLIAGIIMATITLAGGIFFGIRAQRRMSRMSAQLEQIAQGDLSVRLAPQTPKDDLDQLMVRIDHTTERLDQLMSEIKNLSVNLAHEMKTPLARLHASLQQGLERQPLTAVAFENALDETDRINTIFDTILRISRINAGQNQRAFAPIDLGELATDVTDTFSAVVEEKGSTLQLDIREPATIQGDKSALTQAIANLLQNAIVHTKPGKEIILRVTQNRLSVADHGEGIPEAKRADVLKPMARLDQSRTTPGNGLGLALVNAITKLHNAELQLRDTQTTAPHGLTVTLIFPTA